MPADPNSSLSPPNRLPTREAFDALRKASQEGKSEAVMELNQLLDQHPDLWANIGDVSRHVEMEVILAISKGDTLVVESIRRQVEKMRTELAGDESSAMERVLLDRFIVCWLQAHHLDLLYPASADSNERLGRFVIQRKDSAQRQLKHALEALQSYRKSIPAVNGAGKPSLKIHSA